MASDPHEIERARRLLKRNGFLVYGPDDLARPALEKVEEEMNALLRQKLGERYPSAQIIVGPPAFTTDSIHCKVRVMVDLEGGPVKFGGAIRCPSAVPIDSHPWYRCALREYLEEIVTIFAFLLTNKLLTKAHDGEPYMVVAQIWEDGDITGILPGRPVTREEIAERCPIG